MTAPLVHHCACGRTPELSLAEAQWFADKRDSRCGYCAGRRHIRTGSSMTPVEAVRFGAIDDANGFVTARIGVAKVGDAPPEFRAMIARSPAAVFLPEQPALWEYWMDRGWLQIGPPRKRFE